MSRHIPRATLIGGVFYIRRVFGGGADTGDEAIEDLLVLRCFYPH